MSRKLEYSLMVLNEMRGSVGLMTVKGMSQRLGSPFDVTAKVMQRMNKFGLISSEQGVSGGYRIEEMWANTNLYELMGVISGPEGIVRCVTADCDLVDHCKIKTPLLRLNLKLKALYESISLEELLNDEFHASGLGKPDTWEAASSGN